MTAQSRPRGPDLTAGIRADHLKLNEPLRGHVDGKPVVVVRTDSGIHAIGARCTHYGGPLDKGLVVEDTIRCPWHHACFSLRTGRAIDAPAFESVGCYEVKLDGDYVRVGKQHHVDRATEGRPAPGVEPGEAPGSVVIVGGGVAAAACARTLRAEGYTEPITIIGAELPGPVDRPQLSKGYLAGTIGREFVPIGGDTYWRGIDVELIVGDPVTVIDRTARKVRTRSGRDVSWDALLYATGAEPRVPPIEGLELAPHFTLRTLTDSDAIIAAAEGAESPRALILGSSFIGLEVAAALRQRNVEVCVVGRETTPLARVFGREIGEFVLQMHRDRGVEFWLDNTVERFEHDRAFLADGEELAFDFVVLGVGVAPRLELARAAGLEVDAGVRVDEQMRTDAEGIWAAGDVAYFPEFVSRTPARIEHFVLAERQGQAAARSMLGLEQPQRHPPFFWTRQYDTSIKYMGHATSWDHTLVAGSIAERDALVGYVKNGRVIAVAALGRSREALRAERALELDDQRTLFTMLEAGGFEAFSPGMSP